MTSSGSLAPAGLAGWLTTRRIAGIAALGYVIGVSIENQEVLQAPTLSSSVDEIRANYADHAFGIATSFAGAIAQVFFVVLVAALYVWLRERDRAGEPWPTIALVGGIASPVIAAAGLAANSGLVAGAASNDDTVRVLFDTHILTQFIAGSYVALFLGGVGLSSLRSGALPRPLPQLALVVAVPLLFAPIAAFAQEPGLELAVTVSYAAMTFWVFLTGMWLTLADGLSPLAFVRRSAFLLLAIAAGLIGIALLAAPNGTGQFFAWVLRPEPLAAFAGGVYVGAATTYAMALPYSAGRVRALVLGAVVLSVSVLIITLTHTDQFDFDRLQAIMWVVLFSGFSLVTIALFLFDPGDQDGPFQAMPQWARAVFGVVAVAGGALALALWIDPTGISGPSPFDLAPLGGRFAGSWIALLATVCGWIAIRGRVDEARPAAYLLICLPAGALLAALRTIDQLEPAGSAAGYIAVLALLAGAGVAVLAKTDAESSAT